MALDRWLHIGRLRLRSLLRGQTVDRELDEFHVELAKDIVYAARVLRRAPSFTSAAVLSLAIGIGAKHSDRRGSRLRRARPERYADRHRAQSGCRTQILRFTESDRSIDLRRRGQGVSSHRDRTGWPLQHAAGRDGRSDVRALSVRRPQQDDLRDQDRRRCSVIARPITALLDAARAVDPLVPLEGDRLDAVLARSLGQERLLAIIATLFGLMALMLMALGLYGLMACWVTSRTPEIGVRLALGARRRQVVWDVVRLPFTLVGAGLLLGIGVTVAGTRFVSHLLYGLTPEDPATLSASIAFLAVVAATAATFPARRACRIDPVVALRTE